MIDDRSSIIDHRESKRNRSRALSAETYDVYNI